MPIGEPAPRVAIRLLTYNIQFGQRWPEIRALIRAADADVICLQEVPNPEYPLPRVAPREAICADLDLPYACEMLWFDGPRHVGNMTLVRGCIGATTTLCIPGGRPYGIMNEVECGAARFNLVNVHLSPVESPLVFNFWPSERIRRREAVHLNEACYNAALPTVAAGDFNAFHLTPTMQTLASAWRDSRTVRSGGPFATRSTFGLPFVLDHVLLRGDVRAESYRVLDSDASDHRPVLVTLSLAAVN